MTPAFAIEKARDLSAREVLDALLSHDRTENHRGPAAILAPVRPPPTHRYGRDQQSHRLREKWGLRHLIS